MLAGMDLSMGEAVLVALLGFCVVLFELGLISLMIRILSKVVAGFVKDKPAEAKPVPKAVPAAAAPTVPQAADSDDDEIAAALTAILEEMGASPEEVVFLSCHRS